MRGIRVVIVFGTGGHREQARRFVSYLKAESGGNCRSICLSDVGQAAMPGLHVRLGSEFGGRDRIDYWRTARVSAMAMLVMARIVRKLPGKNRILFSLGPGVAIPAALAARALGCRVVHIESWSRFYAKSFSGRFMYWIANDFLVQNKELLSVYGRRAQYVGRL